MIFWWKNRHSRFQFNPSSAHLTTHKHTHTAAAAVAATSTPLSPCCMVFNDNEDHIFFRPKKWRREKNALMCTPTKFFAYGHDDAIGINHVSWCNFKNCNYSLIALFLHSPKGEREEKKNYTTRNKKTMKGTTHTPKLSVFRSDETCFDGFWLFLRFSLYIYLNTFKIRLCIH